jgi:DNA-binding NarL/FixJ family response regulator
VKAAPCGHGSTSGVNRRYARRLPARARAPAVPFRLTPREQDVLELLTPGRTNREIATDLFISEKTASVHVSNIRSKLGANGRAEIAAITVRLDLIREPTGRTSSRGSWSGTAYRIRTGDLRLERAVS